MDSERERLLRCRPWLKGRDSEDSLPPNPELVDFQVRSGNFNLQVHKELTGIPLPGDLRDRILAGRKIMQVPWWTKNRNLLGMAAALVFLATALFLWSRPGEDRSIAGFQARMVGFARREYRMDLFTRDLNELQAFLAGKGRPAKFVLPPQLAARPLKGGASLSWQGKPVAMVCFDWLGGETLYLFILPEDHAAYRQARLEKLKGLTTATWTAGGETYLLAGQVSEADLARLVKL